MIWYYATEKETERTDLSKEVHSEKKSVINFFLLHFFLSLSYIHTPIKKNAHTTTDPNADGQIFLFHIVFIFFVKNRILKKNITINCPFILYPNPKPISNQNMHLWTYSTFLLPPKFPLESFFSKVILLCEGVSVFIRENLSVGPECAVGVRGRYRYAG